MREDCSAGAFVVHCERAAQPQRAHTMNEKDKIQTKPGTDRSDEATRRAVESQEALAQRSEKKTNRQKRGELHTVLAQVIARETRQQKLRDGNATEDDARAEALAIEDDARSRSRRIRAFEPCH